MIRTRTRALFLGLAGLVPASQPDAHHEHAAAPAGSFFPEGTVLYVEGPGLVDLLGRGLEHPLVRRLRATAIGAALEERSPVALEDGLALVDAVLGQPLLPGLAALTGEGWSLGVALVDGRPEGLLVLAAKDPERGRRLLERLQTLGDTELAFVQREELFVAARTERIARKLLRQEEERSLAQDPSFTRLRATRADDALLWAWLDLEALAALPGTDLAGLRAADANPGVHALLGSQLAALTNATRATATLAWDGAGELALELRGHGARTAAGFLPEPAALPPATAPHPDDVATGLVHRDWAAILAEGRDHFAPESLPKLAEADSTLALFFGGRDVAREVLPGVSPWLRVVARRLAFDVGPTPEVPLPGLAFVARLERPAEQGPELAAAFQSLVAVAGVDAAQKRSGRPLVLSLGLEGATAISTGRFLPPRPGDGVDVRYNLRPACATVGQVFVVGTHEELVRELVRELAGAPAAGTAAADERETLTLDGRALAELVRANMETLVTGKVLEEGVTRAEAQDELGGLELLLRSLARTRVDVHRPAADVVGLDVRLALEAGR